MPTSTTFPSYQPSMLRRNSLLRPWSSIPSNSLATHHQISSSSRTAIRTYRTTRETRVVAVKTESNTRKRANLIIRPQPGGTPLQPAMEHWKEAMIKKKARKRAEQEKLNTARATRQRKSGTVGSKQLSPRPLRRLLYTKYLRTNAPPLLPETPEQRPFNVSNGTDEKRSSATPLGAPLSVPDSLADKLLRFDDGQRVIGGERKLDLENLKPNPYKTVSVFSKNQNYSKSKITVDAKSNDLTSQSKIERADMVEDLHEVEAKQNEEEEEEQDSERTPDFRPIEQASYNNVRLTGEKVLRSEHASYDSVRLTMDLSTAAEFSENERSDGLKMGAGASLADDMCGVKAEENKEEESFDGHAAPSKPWGAERWGAQEQQQDQAQTPTISISEAVQAAIKGKRESEKKANEGVKRLQIVEDPAPEMLSTDEKDEIFERYNIDLQASKLDLRVKLKELKNRAIAIEPTFLFNKPKAGGREAWRLAVMGMARKLADLEEVQSMPQAQEPQSEVSQSPASSLPEFLSNERLRQRYNINLLVDGQKLQQKWNELEKKMRNFAPQRQWEFPAGATRQKLKMSVMSLARRLAVLEGAQAVYPISPFKEAQNLKQGKNQNQTEEPSKEQTAARMRPNTNAVAKLLDVPAFKRLRPEWLKDENEAEPQDRLDNVAAGAVGPHKLISSESAAMKNSRAALKQAGEFAAYRPSFIVEANNRNIKNMRLHDDKDEVLTAKKKDENSNWGTISGSDGQQSTAHPEDPMAALKEQINALRMKKQALEKKKQERERSNVAIPQNLPMRRFPITSWHWSGSQKSEPITDISPPQSPRTKLPSPPMRPLTVVPWTRAYSTSRPKSENTQSLDSKSEETSPSSFTPSLPHLTPSGSAHMVSITTKSITARTAIAVGRVRFSNPNPLSLIKSNSLKKGDVLGVARVAGIMAAKKCPEIVPLCHPILLSHVGVELAVVESGEFGMVEIEAKVQCTGATGVEMEALTAVMGAGLTVVDMCKAVDKGMVVEGIRVVLKEGGRSGTWREEGWVGKESGET